MEPDKTKHNVLMLFGAGATASLGSPTTFQQEKFLKCLVLRKGRIRDRLQKGGFKDEELLNDIEVTLRLLYDGDGAKTEIEAKRTRDETEKSYISNALGIKDTKKGAKIHQYLITYVYPCFDWLTFKSISKTILEQGEEENVSLQDILSVLVKSWRENITLPTYELFREEKEYTLPVYLNYSTRVEGALNAYKLLLFKLFKHYLRRVNSLTFDQYEKFCIDTISLSLGSSESYRISARNKEHELVDIVSPIYLATSNWDPIFPFSLMKSCAVINGRANINRKKVLLSYGYPIYIINMKGNNKDCYLCEEDSARLVNLITHEQKINLCKFFAPHGLMNIRICPRCSNAFIVLPDDAGKLSANNLADIFLLDPIPSNTDVKIIREKFFGCFNIEKNLPSHISCPFCGTATFFKDTFLEIQSIVKALEKNVVSKIYADYSVYFSKAEHIVLFGYSFPIDDIPHLLSLLTMCVGGKVEQKKFSIVLYEPNLFNKGWLPASEAINALKRLVREDYCNTINNVLKLAKKENVRINFDGFPQILEKMTLKQIISF